MRNPQYLVCVILLLLLGELHLSAQSIIIYFSPDCSISCVTRPSHLFHTSYLCCVELTNDSLCNEIMDILRQSQKAIPKSFDGQDTQIVIKYDNGNYDTINMFHCYDEYGTSSFEGLIQINGRTYINRTFKMVIGSIINYVLKNESIKDQKYYIPDSVLHEICQGNFMFGDPRCKISIHTK